MPPELSGLEHFHFLRPAFALLIIPWLLMVVVQNRRKARRDLFGGIIAPHLLDHLRLQSVDAHWFNPRNFTTVFMVLSLLLLMGPSWRQQPSPLSQDEAALVVLLDVSSSMMQRDVQPNRLDRAKQKISDLLALRPDKKTALIVYSGSAHTVLSLTADGQILNQYLAAISDGIMPRSGKFPEYSLPLVDEVLRETNAPATVLMFADGLGGDSAGAFDNFFATRPHQLLIVGVGTQKAEEGLAPLERKSLEALADDNGGRYTSLSVDDGDMRKISRQIDSHYVIVQDSALPWLDSGYWLIFPAMALFLMWFREGWTLTWSVLFLPVILASTPTPVLAQQVVTSEATAAKESADEGSHWFADLWLTGDQQGRLLMQLGRYQDSAGRFSDPMWKGLAHYYAEDFMLAAEYFSRSDSDTALFNQANARAHARDYVRAEHRYGLLLARNPNYPGAAENQLIVQRIIEEINRISESQQEEAGVSGEDKELSTDDAIPAQGADEMSWETAELKQLTAQEILEDPATSEMWLRSVQQDPSHFLGIKFSMQLQSQDDAQGAEQ